MDKIMTTHLAGMTFGEMQRFKNMAVIPLFAPGNGRPDYMMLKHALDEKLIAVTEISEGGSVPELKVSNQSDRPVLLLDGEELMGAKQNRVLNTSILIKQKSDLTVPVSCTEQGRWGYNSDAFSYSDTVMSPEARSKKSSSVSAAYMMGAGAVSDQMEVWENLQELHEDVGSYSDTGAMRDAYTSREDDLGDYVKAFPLLPDQRGCLVFLNGSVMALDALSREDAYRTVHDQLIKSYAMDALRGSEDKVDDPSVEKAEAFRQRAEGCRERQFKSPGEGHDHRFEGDRVIGAALVCDGRVIHTSFFKTDNTDTNTDTPKADWIDRLRFWRNR